MAHEHCDRDGFIYRGQLRLRTTVRIQGWLPKGKPTRPHRLCTAVNEVCGSASFNIKRKACGDGPRGGRHDFPQMHIYPFLPSGFAVCERNLTLSPENSHRLRTCCLTLVQLPAHAVCARCPRSGRKIGRWRQPQRLSERASLFVISSPIILNALKILSPRVARRVVTGPIFQGQMGGRFLFASFLYFGWPKREMKPQMQLGAAE